MGSYVPNTLEERKKMLQEIGYSSIEDLFAHIPEEVKLKGELNIPKGKTEFEVTARDGTDCRKEPGVPDNLPRSRSLQTFYPGQW